MLAAECTPYAWTGGLGDVVGSLPTALRTLGADVRVALPHYGAINPAAHPITTSDAALRVSMNGAVEHGKVEQVRQSPFPLYLIGSDEYFANRPDLYGYADDGHRFVFFSRGALAATRTLEWRPDVVHCHDWHSGLVPNWIHAARSTGEHANGPATVLTIHNLAYQGHFGEELLHAAGLADDEFPEVPADPGTAPRVNFLARGIRYADAVNTVSATYARQILTTSYGEGLDALLRERGDGIAGIVNGIDTATFDPATDSHLAANFSVRDTTPRARNKAALQRELGLPVKAEAPLLGMVSRLADHKGLDLLAPVVPHVVERGAQLAVLGTGDPRHHELLSQAASQHPDHVAVALRFDPPLAQRIYGGSDMFLMPSRHEPCGLGQLIAMRYGNVPIVRATGGLADTVADFDARTMHGSGFVFHRYDPIDFFGAIARALETYRHPDAWHALMRQGMSRDSSWDAAARAYLDLYSHALDR